MQESADFLEPFNYPNRFQTVQLLGKPWELSFMELNSGKGVSIGLKAPESDFF